METVMLQPLLHKGAECIGIFSPQNATLNYYFQKKAGAKWSRTNKCWYILCTEKNYEILAKVLSGKALLQTDELKKYLLEKKKNKLIAPELNHNKPVIKPGTVKDPSIQSKVTQQANSLYRLSKENTVALQKFKQQLILKSYSPSTIRTYTNELMQFLYTIKDKPASDFSTSRIKDYLQYCHSTLKLSEATLHSRMNALKFYFEQVLKKEKFFWEIPRPKKPLQLPKVISKEQVAQLINAIENTKHKTIIMLAYACGLRVSEVVSLKIKHIDSQRKIIFIERAKGKKDRIVSLGPGMLIMLREYYRQYKPTDYLFEGQFENEHLSERSIQQVLQKAKEKAGIKQSGSMHMLRHSFATHLLDKGIDVVFIQKLLGHNDIKTTLKYLHVTNKDLIHILSPLEDIENLLKK
jgi:integrase/recombinase XerD